MAKDYARKYKTPPKRHKKSAPPLYARSLFVVFVLVLVIIAGGAGYFYYQHPFAKSAASSKSSQSHLPPITEAKGVSLNTPVEEAKEEPVDYEFYTLLPKISVPDPTQDNTPPGEQPGFWLQLMVYYGMRDASAFVDRLQLLGLDPVIVQRKSTKNDRILYIVALGPFTTKEAATARQQDLKKMSLSSYIYHIDPPVVAATPEPAASLPSTVPVVSATPVDL